MTLPTLFYIVIAPAVVCLLAYFPLLSYMTLSLVSTYPKADMRRRLFAAAVDGLIVVTPAVLYWNSSFLPLWNASFWPLVVTGVAYLVFRDGIRGQSLGKLVAGLVVIDLTTGRPATLAVSLRRNLLLLGSGASFIVVLLEAKTVISDPQGQRLGDRLAHTQVVEGLGARDLVKAWQQWLLGFGWRFGRSVSRPGYRPAEVDRRRRRAA